MSSVKAVYKSINKIQIELAKSGINKVHKNLQQGYKFRGVDDVYNGISSLLGEHGLCILPRMLTRTHQERQTQKGGVLFYVTVEAEFDFVSSDDGSMHTVRTFGEAMDSGDKATNKAMSAAYKYACIQAFAIPTEGNNDADNNSPDVKPETKPEPTLSNNKFQKVDSTDWEEKIKKAKNRLEVTEIYKLIPESNKNDYTKACQLRVQELTTLGEAA